MYVRWKRTKRKDRWGYGDTLTAVLVKSERVNGQPRQKFIAHLGSIREGRIDVQGARLNFWDNVEAKLASLPEEQADRIREKLSQKVAYMPREQREKLHEEGRRFYAQLGAILKRM